MTAREYLDLISDYTRERDRLEEKLMDWRQRAETPSGVDLSEQMAAHGAKKDLSDYVARLEALQKDWIHAYMVLLDAKKVMIGQIKDMDDEREAAVLYYRYLLLWKWEEIAKVMGDVRNVYRIHGKALQHFGDLHAAFLASL